MKRSGPPKRKTPLRQGDKGLKRSALNPAKARPTRALGSSELTTRGTPRQRAGRVQRACEQCGAEFWAAPSRLRLGYDRYCGRECSAAAQREPVELTCDECGEPFTATRSQVAAGRKCCSRRCAAAMQRGRRSVRHTTGKYAGKQHFKSGQTQCQHPACERGGHSLHEHHVVYEQAVARVRPSDRHDPRNALAVCVQCHSRHHHGIARLPLSALRDANYAYAAEVLGDAAYDYLRKRYAGSDPRLFRLLAPSLANPADWIAAEELDDALEAAGRPRTAILELRREHP